MNTILKEINVELNQILMNQPTEEIHVGHSACLKKGLQLDSFRKLDWAVGVSHFTGKNGITQWMGRNE